MDFDDYKQQLDEILYETEQAEKTIKKLEREKKKRKRKIAALETIINNTPTSKRDELYNQKLEKLQRLKRENQEAEVEDDISYLQLEDEFEERKQKVALLEITRQDLIRDAERAAKPSFIMRFLSLLWNIICFPFLALLNAALYLLYAFNFFMLLIFAIAIISLLAFIIYMLFFI